MYRGRAQTKVALTVVSEEAFGLDVVRSRSDEAANEVIDDGDQQDDEQAKLRLCLPLHPNDDDHGQDDDRYRPDDAHVLDLSVDDHQAETLEQVRHRLAEADDVHGARNRVRQREYQPDRSAEFGSQRTRYHVVRSS